MKIAYDINTRRIKLVHDMQVKEKDKGWANWHDVNTGWTASHWLLDPLFAFRLWRRSDSSVEIANHSLNSHRLCTIRTQQMCPNNVRSLTSRYYRHAKFIKRIKYQFDSQMSQLPLVPAPLSSKCTFQIKKNIHKLQMPVTNLYLYSILMYIHHLQKRSNFN